MMSNGFIVNAEVIGPEEDADILHTELKVRDGDVADEGDDSLFVVEMEIGAGGQTVMFTEPKAAALAEALCEILKRYGWRYFLKKNNG